MGWRAERAGAKRDLGSGRPVGLGALADEAAALDQPSEQPSDDLGQFLSTGSGLLGGWSMAGLGGSFGSETWRDAELREERRALLRELRDRELAAPPGRRNQSSG